MLSHRNGGWNDHAARMSLSFLVTIIKVLRMSETAVDESGVSRGDMGAVSSDSTDAATAVIFAFRSVDSFAPWELTSPNLESVLVDDSLNCRLDNGIWNIFPESAQRIFSNFRSNAHDLFLKEVERLTTQSIFVKFL